MSSFSIVEDKELDMYVIESVRLSAYPSCIHFLIFDAFFDHYHELSVSYKFHPNRLNFIYMHASSLSAVSFIFPFN